MATVNRAAAVALADGPHVGLAILATLDGVAHVEHYQPLHALRAELLARSGNLTDAGVAYRTAIDLAPNAAQRAALRARAARMGCEP